MKQKSYVMVKPWFASQQSVIDEVKKRLVKAGLKIDKEKFVQYDVEHARKHYAAHVGKDFYPHLEEYITGSKAYGMVVSGDDAINKIRTLVGSTKEPAKGTIRHDIPVMLNIPIRVTENVVHASDATDAAKIEIEIFDDLANKKLGDNL